MVGLAYEIHETWILKEKRAKNENELETNLKYYFMSIEPSFIDIFLYGYCYIGIFTGGK